METTDSLQQQIDDLREKLEFVAQMIVDKGTLDPGPAEGELPLRDRVEELERQVESLTSRFAQKA